MPTDTSQVAMTFEDDALYDLALELQASTAMIQNTLARVDAKLTAMGV